jgi:hypothetical protein
MVLLFSKACCHLGSCLQASQPAPATPRKRKLRFLALALLWAAAALEAVMPVQRAHQLQHACLTGASPLSAHAQVFGGQTLVLSFTYGMILLGAIQLLQRACSQPAVNIANKGTCRHRAAAVSCAAVC